MRPKTTNSDLPRGVIRRKKGAWTGYYLNVTQDGKRMEIPLGKSKEEALHNLLLRSNTLQSEQPDWNKVLRRVWYVTEKRARSRNLEFDITVEDVLNMFTKAAGRCVLSNISFSLEKDDDKRFRPWLPSLDRLDNKRGYTKDNCRLVCAYVNVAINQFGEGIFLFVSRQISEHMKRLENARLAEIAEIAGNSRPVVNI